MANPIIHPDVTRIFSSGRTAEACTVVAGGPFVSGAEGNPADWED
jgi:hypothetical protein